MNLIQEMKVGLCVGLIDNVSCHNPSISYPKAGSELHLLDDTSWNVGRDPIPEHEPQRAILRCARNGLRGSTPRFATILVSKSPRIVES
jgi:hypothetical protein